MLTKQNRETLAGYIVLLAIAGGITFLFREIDFYFLYNNLTFLPYIVLPLLGTTVGLGPGVAATSGQVLNQTWQIIPKNIRGFYVWSPIGLATAGVQFPNNGYDYGPDTVATVTDNDGLGLNQMYFDMVQNNVTKTY